MKKKSGEKSFVVISRAEEMDYLNDYVSLPADYGTPRYYSRTDVKSIIRTVNENLTTLDEKIRFTEKLKDRHVVIKPNLVTVFHNFGFVKKDYPNTTDPRVLDAVIAFLKNFTSRITIAESSGRGVPTRGSFRTAGIDRLAKRYGAKLMPLEEQPVDRYILPRAEVMKEIIVPRVFTEIAEGNAFYISMPKLKTNLYTQVTLGFKNSMGCLSYNMRQRNHTFDIDRKLVDMLHLFKPGLVIIDGIVGAEGQCPAPVDPVKSNVIISGNNSVETDSAAAKLMGFNPDTINLMKYSKAAGFGDPGVIIIGSAPAVKFKPADPSLSSEGFRNLFPNVKFFVGHSHPHSPKIKKASRISPKVLSEMEFSCRGGCLATTRVGFDYYHHEGLDRNFNLALIIGAGTLIDGKKYYFDHDGNPVSADELKNLPERKLALGSCARQIKDAADFHVEGCMIAPNAAHMMIHALSGNPCRIVSIKGPSFIPLGLATLGMRFARIRRLLSGDRLDCEESFSNEIVSPLMTVPAGENKPYIKYDMPPMGLIERFRLIKKEISETVSLLF